MGGLSESRFLNSGFGQKGREKKCPRDFHGENGRYCCLAEKEKVKFWCKLLSVMISQKILVQPHFNNNKKAYH